MAQYDKNAVELERELVGHVQLLTNRALSTTEDEYLQGYHAAQREMSEEENPYQVNSRAYRNWNDGWWDGLYNEEAVFVSRSENIIPFPIQMTAASEAKAPSALPAFIPKLSEKWKEVQDKASFFKQSWLAIFIEVFAAVFVVGLAYELAT